VKDAGLPAVGEALVVKSADNTAATLTVCEATTNLLAESVTLRTNGYEPWAV